MGAAFPTGLTQLERIHAPAVRWAWALNAAASVLGSVMAVALALYLGLRETLLTGALMYLGAWAMTRRWGPAAPVLAPALSRTAAAG